MMRGSSSIMSACWSRCLCSSIDFHVNDVVFCFFFFIFLFFQAEDGIRDLVRSRGLGDVYKRQVIKRA